MRDYRRAEAVRNKDERARRFEICVRCSMARYLLSASVTARYLDTMLTSSSYSKGI